MTEQEKSRILELVELVNKYSYEYHVNDNPLISDKDYDKLFYELVDLEQKTGYVLPNSPTKRIGAEPLDKFEKAKHLSKLYSLDKAQTNQEIQEWYERNQKIQKHIEEFSVEYKFDGLAMEIIYENGTLIKAITRGNGEIGEDVTEQIKTIKTVPLTIKCKDLLGIQGEAIMRLSTLKVYNKKADEPLKNARNAAAGAVRNLDPKETAKRRLDFVAYNVNYSRSTQFLTQEQIHKFLIEEGFFCGEYFVLAHSINEIYDQIKIVTAQRKNLDYLIDGMVIKVNSIADRQELGFTERFPRGMVAYKFEPEEATTILKNIVWQVGRTGKITPVAELEPIEIGGTTIARATLNNVGDIRRKNIKINSRVFICRSNEVIPEILGVAECFNDSVDVEPPKICPACGTKLVEEGANLFCPNEKECEPQIIGRLVHFASKNAMNIEGISDKTALQLHNKLSVNYPSDLYSLTKNQLERLEKFKEKKSNNIYNSIQNSKKTNLTRFIYALGIDGIGKKTANVLSKRFKTLEGLIAAKREELISLDDIAEITADNVILYFKNHMHEVNRLIDMGITISTNNEQSNERLLLSGEKIVLTGTLQSYSRNEATAILESLGAEVQSNVTKTTSLVIAGNNVGSKLQKAKNLGIKIINEIEFLELLNKKQ